jgi:predicted DNA-binding transcriptional regulator AlpA
MPVKIAGTTYFSVEDIQRDHGVVRQSLWRWRKAGKVPKGLRYRGRQIVFTKREVDAIREYANRLEPSEAS